MSIGAIAIVPMGKSSISTSGWTSTALISIGSTAGGGVLMIGVTRRGAAAARGVSWRAALSGARPRSTASAGAAVDAMATSFVAFRSGATSRRVCRATKTAIISIAATAIGTSSHGMTRVGGRRAPAIRAATRSASSASAGAEVIALATSSISGSTLSSKAFPHEPARFGHAPFDGSGFRLQHRAHLVVGVLVCRRQQKRVAHFLRQLPDRVANLLAQLRVRREILRRPAWRCERHRLKRRAFFALHAHEPSEPPRRFPPVIHGLIPGDRQHPRLERRLAPEAFQPLKGEQKRFLRDVVRIGGRSDG